MTIAGYSVLLERKASASIQGRIGPNRTIHPLIGWIPFLGTFLQKGGFIQPAADGGKFLFKEDALPGHVRKTYYVLAPIVALAPALAVLVMLPFGEFFHEGKRYAVSLTQGADVGVLPMFAVELLGVYGIALAGWSANSKFPFLGAVRGAAQLISYELAMGLSVLTVFLATSAPGVDQRPQPRRDGRRAAGRLEPAHAAGRRAGLPDLRSSPRPTATRSTCRNPRPTSSAASTPSTAPSSSASSSSPNTATW
jgi:NADH:ubiquinone oxidoreductase subunit H